MHRNVLIWLTTLTVTLFASFPLAAQQNLDIRADSSGAKWLDTEEGIEVLEEGKGWFKLRFWDDPAAATGKGEKFAAPAYRDRYLVGVEGIDTVPLSEREKTDIRLDLDVESGGGSTSIGLSDAADVARGASPMDWVLIDIEASQQLDAGLPVTNGFTAMKRTFEKTFDFNEGGQHELWNYSNNAFSGNLTANVPITGTVHVKVNYKIRLSGIKIREVLLEGNVTVDGNVDLTGELEASRQFSTTHRLFEIPLYKYKLLGVTLVEIALDSHVGFDASARIRGELGVSTDVDLNGTFRYHCQNGNCTSTSNFTDNLDTDVSLGVELEAEAEGWARARVWGKFISSRILRAEIGARGWIGADLWGYYGNTCGDGDGDGTNEWVRALAVGARAGYEVPAGIRGIFGRWDRVLTSREYSLGWWDLLGTGGSTALSPMIHGPASVTAGQAVSYNVKMRPCYPYEDAVTFTTTPTMSGPTTVTPGTATAVSHTFSGTGTQQVTVLATQDAKGRNLQMPFARDITVAPAPTGPTIVSHPANRSVSPGTTATFSVGVVGTAPFTYQWKRNGINLSNGGHFSGADSAQLSVSNVDSSVIGSYSVVVANAAGQSTSNNAQLTLATGGGGGGGGGGGACSIESFNVFNFSNGLPRVQWETDCPSPGDISVQVLTSTVGSVPSGCALSDALWDGGTDGNRTVDYMTGGYNNGCPAVTSADFHIELIDTVNGNQVIETSTTKRATFNPPPLTCDITEFTVDNRDPGELPLITWSTTCPDPGPVSVQVRTTTSSPAPAGCEVSDALWSGDKNGSRTPDYMEGGYGASCPAVTEAWFWIELWEGNQLIRRTNYELARYEP